MLKEKHPEIKNVVDIKESHIQEWINDRGKNWSLKTLENHMTKIKYLEEQSKKVFGRDNVNFQKLFFQICLYLLFLNVAERLVFFDFFIIAYYFIHMAYVIYT